MRDCAMRVRETMMDMGQQHCDRSANDAVTAEQVQRSTKRARVDNMRDRDEGSDTFRLRNEAGTPEHHPECCQGNYSSLTLPLHLVNVLVDIYFDKVHPWIPLLHVRNFRRRILDPTERRKLDTVLDAIVSLWIRFSDDVRFQDNAKRAKVAKACRDRVILRSMESFSVETLQALIICAFETGCISFLCIDCAMPSTDILECRLVAVGGHQLG